MTDMRVYFAVGEERFRANKYFHDSKRTLTVRTRST